jgi:sulfur relay (sulfurtransferase) DsrF/TusC family protein
MLKLLELFREAETYNTKASLQEYRLLLNAGNINRQMTEF